MSSFDEMMSNLDEMRSDLAFKQFVVNNAAMTVALATVLSNKGIVSVDEISSHTDLAKGAEPFKTLREQLTQAEKEIEEMASDPEGACYKIVESLLGLGGTEDKGGSK